MSLSSTAGSSASTWLAIRYAWFVANERPTSTTYTRLAGEAVCLNKPTFYPYAAHATERFTTTLSGPKKTTF